MTNFIDTLFATIQDRKTNPKTGSYTNSLFDKGDDAICQKVGEEAVEVIIAAKGQGRQRLIEETADLTYHLLVLLAEKGLTWNDICGELEKRHK